MIFFSNFYKLIGVIFSLVILIFLCQSCIPNANPETDNGDINGLILYRYDSAGTSFIDSFKAIDYTPSVSTDLIVADTIKLSVNKSYTFKAKFVKVDEKTKVLTDVSNEIWVLRDQHNLIFFPTTTVANLNITYLDSDSHGYPVGFTTRWKATIPNSISVLANLRHLPTAKTADVNLNLDLGTSDYSVPFPTVVK